MSKTALKKEINRYIAFGYSIDNACMQINNLHHNKYLFKIYEIAEQMKADAAK